MNNQEISDIFESILFTIRDNKNLKDELNRLKMIMYAAYVQNGKKPVPFAELSSEINENDIPNPTINLQGFSFNE